MFDTEVARTFDRRAALFLTGGAVLTSALVLRMLQLQVFQHGKYKRMSETNASRIQINPPERGKILSRNGTQLAKDEAIYRVFVIPEESDDVAALLETLRRKMNLGARTMARIQKSIDKQRKFQPTLIAEGVKWEMLAELKTSDLSGLHIERGFARRYPGGKFAAQTLGYVSIDEGASAQRTAITSPFFMTGAAGLERVYDRSLSGSPGRTIITVDATGRQLGEDAQKSSDPRDGKNLQTTLDDGVQSALEKALSAHRAGCGVAMEIESGEILAIASNPAFNADDFRGENSAEVFADLTRDPLKPFMNKAIEGLYPPGSTFKIVVALAALEAGVIKPNEKIRCPGYWEYGNHRYHCWEKDGHGMMNMEDALAHSCDIYFYQVALRVGVDAIHNMAERLGLGQKLLNELPREMAGVIPDKNWKERHVGQRWMHGDTIITGIGQGYVLTNCLQLCVMVARAASNKTVLPNIIKNKNKDFSSLKLNPEHVRIVLSGLAKVMEKGGTAAWAAINVNGAKMGGKTGTSQVRNISMAERRTGVLRNEQLKWEQRNHGLFVGFAPTDIPKYAVAVITEHSGGSGLAAGAAAATMRAMLGKK